MADDPMIEEVLPACRICRAADFSEGCDETHTETVMRLAEAIGRHLAGPPGHPENHPEWYIEDAVVVEGFVKEAAGWVIESDEGSLAEFFTVNGTEFWLDTAAEGFTSPVLAADRRAELAEEASWEDE